MKNDKNIALKRLVRSYLSSVISISLVLLLIASVCFIGANAKIISDYLKENTVLSVILQQDIEEDEAKDLAGRIGNMPFVREAEYISKERGQEEMKKLLGEDFLDVFEASPIPISIDVKLCSEWFSKDSIQVASRMFSEIGEVREVSYQESLVDALNSNLESIGVGVAIVTALLLFISMVLIGNTVRLHIHSRRFSIHTMRLVGAKRSFIRRPFLRQAAVQGAVAGLIADGAFATILHFLHREIGDTFGLFDNNLIIAIFAVVLATGIVICALTAAVMVSRMADISKDDLYI